MRRSSSFTLSVVVPIFNEAPGLAKFHESLVGSLKKIEHLAYEIIYCDDGSSDNSGEIIRGFSSLNEEVRLITLTRNFGKEYAMTAGTSQARGDAILIIDGDGQHPVKLIPEFVNKWRAGDQVVIGVRKEVTGYSKAFYRLFNRFSGERLIAGATDFRLMDREVAEVFLRLSENGRMTRALIDWLGYERAYIEFEVGSREHGTATYSSRQLIQLAVNSFISLSNVPLFLFGYLGVIITFLSGILGLLILIEQVILRDPLSWKFTGTAMLGVLILFLIGIVLMSQGILALYISHIHMQVKRRPLYVINRSRSIGLKD